MSYAEYCNRRTKKKHFNVVEEVLVLAPVSSNKIYSRWHGPCTIPHVRESYSYVVDMGDGSHLVGIIKEDDDEIGEMPF